MNKNLPPLEEKEIDEQTLKKKTRRSFLAMGFFGALGLLGIRWIGLTEDDRGIPWVLRRLNDFNDSFWKDQFREQALVSEATPDGKPFRVNGDIGMEKSIDAEAWRLRVIDPGGENHLNISMKQIRELPATTMKFEFKCVEGWSQAIECKGVKFSEFMETFEVGFMPSMTDDQSPYAYAGLTSINDGYYVSMDIKSLWHPQTLLCYEINGEALTLEHGAPLRLMTATKYGVKNIKQLGRIEFSNSQPKDYWAENGYQDTLMF